MFFIWHFSKLSKKNKSWFHVTFIDSCHIYQVFILPLFFFPLTFPSIHTLNILTLSIYNFCVIYFPNNFCCGFLFWRLTTLPICKEITQNYCPFCPKIIYNGEENFHFVIVLKEFKRNWVTKLLKTGHGYCLIELSWVRLY